MGLVSSDQIRGWNVSHKLQKRKLLIAINCIAATSIFFFGTENPAKPWASHSILTSVLQVTTRVLCRESTMLKVCSLINSVLNSRYSPGLDYIETMSIGYVKPDGTPQITNAVLQGGIVAAYYLGTLVGALFGGWAGEKIGRIRMIAAGAAWSVLGVSLQCSAQNHTW